MTKREILEKKVVIYKQWLSLLIQEGVDEHELGLPRGVTKLEEIDRILDILIRLREQLKDMD